MIDFPMKDSPFCYKPPERKCTIDGCDRLHKAHGLCERHYQAARRGTNPEFIRMVDGDQGCIEQDCNKQHYGLGFCRMHYQRERRRKQ